MGTGVTTGYFDTNGNNKAVVISVSRLVRRTKGARGSTGFVAGAGTNTMTVNVYRQIAGQGETFWTSFNAGGGVNIQNEPDGADLAESTWNGSITLYDALSGAAQRTYRAEIVSYSEQAVTHTSGTFEGQTINQSLSIVSIEQ